METILVTDQPSCWKFLENLVPVVEASDYLSAETWHGHKSLRVINLCECYSYQSIGYYVSLLAHARNHKAMPSVHSIQDVLNAQLSKRISEDIHDEIQHTLKHIKTNTFIISLYFGQNMAKHYASLARKLHGLFPLPLLRIHLEKKREWHIRSVEPLSYNKIPLWHLEFMRVSTENYLSKKRIVQWKKKQYPHDLAILIDPDEKHPPSNKKAIENFIKAGEETGFNVELMEKNNTKSIAEYDALFIRATTSVNHFTYRLARRAIQENLVVIDDPESIIKCTNKVYLAELLKSHQIAIPETIFINKHDMQNPAIKFPCVLKQPDGAFSEGVIKVENYKELQKNLKHFFKTSDLVLAQTFIPTEFDWRIGILDNKPLFACRYWMAKDHWQIYNWEETKELLEGKNEAVPLEQVPDGIIKTALKSTKLIGDSLYGVDIKSYGSENYVIEINDNPNIDNGFEDSINGETLYKDIMQIFLQRIRRKHGYD